MAVTGVVLMGYVLLHMVGNLKLYMGQTHFNEYADWLRIFGAPAVPDTSFLWIMRGLLLVAFTVHIHAAFALWRMNRRARPTAYQSKRDYIAADFAARTMRWTGIIVSCSSCSTSPTSRTGHANPDFDHADVYMNLVASFSAPRGGVLHRGEPRAGSAPVPRRLEPVPDDGLEQPALQPLAALVRRRVRRDRRRRQRQLPDRRGHRLVS
jgi:succinate dehydrogenase/fumarate reductase cytochrome b subunit (b558 family)